jgi:alkylation response protein AidB-like acyl-CoA dehydrogenase
MRLVADTAEEQLRAEFRAFFDEHCPVGYADGCDAEGRFPQELFQAAAAAGMFRLTIAPEYGGRGERATALAILLQEAGRAFADFANTIVRSQTLCARLVEAFGSEEQRDALLPRFANGTMHMAFATSEPGAGSDALALSTTAVRDGDGWLLHGEKRYATGADVADAICVIARLEGTAGREGLAAFVVEPDAPGLTIERHDTLGVRGTGTASLRLDGVRAGDDAALGEPGRGWAVLVSGLDLERMATAAIATGASRFLIEHVIEFLRARRQFGAPLAELQAVRHHVADAAMRVDAAELATFRVASLLDRGRPAHLESSVAKLVATEAYMETAHRAVQLEGGWGYTFDQTVQRHFRDAKMYEIGGGASDVQRDIIAKGLGL